VADVTGFRGQLLLDTTKPDGTPRKLLDVSRLRQLGWESRITLSAGIASTVQWYRANRASVVS
jgi:GDP-L-fucose synthase